MEVFRGKRGGFSTSLFEAITVGIALYVDYYEADGNAQLSQRIEKLKNDEDFEKNMGSASNNKIRIVNRINIAEKIFKSQNA